VKKPKEKPADRRSNEEEKRARWSESGPHDNDVAELAKKAGLSVKRYNRKLKRGEIVFDSDGNPTALSKKELKRGRKESKKAAKAAKREVGKKRKRTLDDQTEARAEKTKRRKSKA
jgi:nucleolar protein 58